MVGPSASSGPGPIRTSRPSAVRRRPSLSSSWFIFILFNAAIRSTARVVVFGGSSMDCSQPIGGEPGGEMSWLRGLGGTLRWIDSGSIGEVDVGSPRYILRVFSDLQKVIRHPIMSKKETRGLR